MFKKGFTLIELLVVVLIIAILAAVALPQYTKAVEKARASEAFLNIKALADAQERYYLANDTYTAALTNLDVTVSDNNNFTYSCNAERSCLSRRKNEKFHIEAFLNNIPSSHITYPYSGKKLCIAVNGDDDGGKICQALGGTKISDTFSTSNVYYQLP
ncbi:type II secretion system protein G [Parelusimicrobium proximum]|uniref:type IV pilin protein n=1 Tax=Parelusimicrobium proximum TaxID=3228953 RepID=UPI003D183A27